MLLKSPTLTSGVPTWQLIAVLHPVESAPFDPPSGRIYRLPPFLLYHTYSFTANLFKDIENLYQVCYNGKQTPHFYLCHFIAQLPVIENESEASVRALLE
jgi:hypothetical protein